MNTKARPNFKLATSQSLGFLLVSIKISLWLRTSECIWPYTASLLHVLEYSFDLARLRVIQIHIFTFQIQTILFKGTKIAHSSIKSENELRFFRALKI